MTARERRAARMPFGSLSTRCTRHMDALYSCYSRLLSLRLSHLTRHSTRRCGVAAPHCFASSPTLLLRESSSPSATAAAVPADTGRSFGVLEPEPRGVPFGGVCDGDFVNPTASPRLASLDDPGRLFSVDLRSPEPVELRCARSGVFGVTAVRRLPDAAATAAAAAPTVRRARGGFSAPNDSFTMITVVVSDIPVAASVSTSVHAKVTGCDRFTSVKSMAKPAIILSVRFERDAPFGAGGTATTRL
mmetsp:Transcript_8751/g.27200  ORF Transcript_8751/g.27200 Transcript_8751/m.27200 type:complete len:246 (+) Transcript_8751:15-752(+)